MLGLTVFAGFVFIAWWSFQRPRKLNAPALTPDITCSVCGQPKTLGPSGYYCERCEVGP